MKKYLPVLLHSPLFSGVSEKELIAMLDCLAATTADYAKNEFILRCGERPGAVGLVLNGARISGAIVTSLPRPVRDSCLPKPMPVRNAQHLASALSRQSLPRRSFSICAAS